MVDLLGNTHNLGEFPALLPSLIKYVFELLV